MAGNATRLLLIVDLLGTFVFALQGALAGIQSELDLFGVMVVSFATALGGGILRDILIGASPPVSIRDWRYSVTAFAGGGTAFFFYDAVRAVHPSVLLTLDAAGLSLFAVAGAAKALEFGIHPFIAILMGGLTGVGGGTIRDVLLARVPIVLRADVYATAALAGAAVLVISSRLPGSRLKLPRSIIMFAGAALCFLLRIVSVWKHWNLPKVAAW